MVVMGELRGGIFLTAAGGSVREGHILEMACLIYLRLGTIENVGAWGDYLLLTRCAVSMLVVTWKKTAMLNSTHTRTAENLPSQAPHPRCHR